MIALSILQLALLGGSVWLFVRLERARRALAEPTTTLETKLNALQVDYIEGELLGHADGRGFSSLGIRHLEGHDEPVDVATLIERVLANPLHTPREKEDAIKHVYQIGWTLGADASAVEGCLAPILDAIQGSEFMGRTVAKTRSLSPGELVDRRTMWPLTNGSRVTCPLGVVLYDHDGKVLSRAKTLCH